ncbi:polysaccharide deacetylase family protein [Rossellomorea sp. GAMAL-10_SWC]
MKIFRNIEQLKELQNNGLAIINQTNTHKRLDTLPIEQQIEEIETAKTWLLDNGFDSGSKLIVYPYGAYTTEIINYLEKNHYYATRTLVNEI